MRSGNSLLITNGGQLWATGLNVGKVAGDNNNSVQVLNGSLLEGNSLVIAAGTIGNTDQQPQRDLSIHHRRAHDHARGSGQHRDQ